MRVATLLLIWCAMFAAFNLAPGCASTEGHFNPLVSLDVSQAGLLLGDYATWEQRFPDVEVEVYLEEHAYWMIYTLWVHADGAAVRRAEFASWQLENVGGLFVEWATEVGEARPVELETLVDMWVSESGTSQFANMIALRWVTKHPKLERYALGIAAFLSRLGVG